MDIAIVCLVILCGLVYNNIKYFNILKWQILRKGRLIDMDILQCRTEIDRIDKEIVALFEKRLQVSVEVAKYKMKTGKKVYDKEREVSKLDSLKQMANNDFNKQGIEELFTQIMSISRKLQYSIIENGNDYRAFEKTEALELEGKKVVFYGETGAYTEQAMEEYFGDDVDSFNEMTFRGVMEALKDGRADYGVLPIENSSTGGISDIYDLLLEYNNCIVGEHTLKIEQCLLGLEDATTADIQEVFSHPQGIMQSQKFLEEHENMHTTAYLSTASSAKKVAEDGNIHQAAIASRRAAKCYGLKVLEENINYESTNSTRFIIITNKKLYTKDANKVSLCFQLPHESGSLYNMLSHFIFNNLNLTGIESRPIEGKKWEYRFFVEFEGNLNSPGVQNAINGIYQEAQACRVLGNFETK